MEADLDLRRMEIKRREVEASYARLIQQAERLSQADKQQQRNLKKQAAAFHAIKDELLRVGQAAASPRDKVKHVDFQLAKLRKQKALLEQSGNEARSIKARRTAHGALLQAQKTKSEKLGVLVEAGKCARMKKQREREDGNLADELAALSRKDRGEGQDECIEDARGVEEPVVLSADQLVGSFPESSERYEAAFSAQAGGNFSQNSSLCDGGQANQSSNSGNSASSEQHERQEYLQQFASQVASIESWDGPGGSGVELEFTNSEGHRSRVVVRRTADELVNVCLMPEFEKDRRVLWAEKGRIIEALQGTGLKIGQVVIRKGVSK